MDPEAPARGNSNWPSSSSSSSSSHAVGPSQWPAVSGGLSIYTAFSRDGSGAGVVGCAGAAQGKEYVQTCIARKGKTVWRLLQDGGIVYIAGAAGAMPQDVVAAIGAVAREHGGLEEEQVEEWLLQLRAARAYRSSAGDVLAVAMRREYFYLIGTIKKLPKQHKEACNNTHTGR